MSAMSAKIAMNVEIFMANFNSMVYLFKKDSILLKSFVQGRGMENSTRRNMTRKRCALRGGGFSTAPTSFFPPAGFMAPRETIQWQPEQGLAYARNGMLVNQPNPALAQVAMAGGGRRRRLERLRRRMQGGGCGCGQKGGGLSYAPVGSMSNLYYGISGKGGYETNPGVSVGAAGPNVGALISPNGCAPSLRAGMVGGTRKKQRGGGGSTYTGASCLARSGSELPVYPNPSAGFNQSPSTWSLPPGVANAYQLYNPTIARVGGGRKTKRCYRR
jgi:hypothetical protein